MLQVTCSREGCKTPYFLVDPDDGYIRLSDGVSGGDIKFSAEKSEALQKVLKSRPNGALSADESQYLNDLIAELKAMSAIVPNITKKTLFEELKEESGENKPNDYLVVYCKTKHKNYIPFYNKNKEKLRKERESQGWWKNMWKKKNGGNEGNAEKKGNEANENNKENEANEKDKG